VADVDADHEIRRFLTLADRIEQVVEARSPKNGRFATRDRNDQVLAAACGRAARCFRSMRLLAEQSLGEDALVLARTLFSIAVHSLYLATPDDVSERRSRSDAWAADFIARLDKQESELRVWGLEEEDLASLAEQRDRLRNRSPGRFPREGSIAALLGDPWPLLYSQVFRSASEATHFSIGAALDAFENLSGSARVIHWDGSDARHVNNALLYGILIYDSFLAAADAILETGVSAEVTPLILRSGIRIVE
jgi:hypothetical protein